MSVRGGCPSPIASANPHAPQPSRASPTERGEEGGPSRRVASEPRAQTPMLEAGRPRVADTGGRGVALGASGLRSGGGEAEAALEVAGAAASGEAVAAMEAAEGGARVTYGAKESWPA